MNGKVCVVTGASGFRDGKAAATALARVGSQVVLVGRDRGRAEAAAAEIGAIAPVRPKVPADFVSMEQMRALGGRLAARDGTPGPKSTLSKGRTFQRLPDPGSVLRGR